MFQNCRISGVNVNADDYHAKRAKQQRGTPEFVMSASSINAFAKLPSRWRRGWNPPDSKAKTWGNLLDTRALTPELFTSRYATQPEKYPVDTMKCPSCGSISDSRKCSKCKTEREMFELLKPWRKGAGYCDEWTAREVSAGKQIISPKLVADCDAAIARLMEVVDGDDTIPRWFAACEKQVLLEGEWHDEETELTIPVCALLDFVPRADSEFVDCLGDLKTAMSAHSLAFQRHAFKLGYHRQAAFNLDFFNACHPEAPRNTWCFIVSESFDPWEPNRCMYGQEDNTGAPTFIEIGRRAGFGGYEGILTNYCKCLKSGKWPRYNDIDEAAQGWAILRPEPFDAERASRQPLFEFQSGDEAPESESDGGFIDPDDVNC